MSGQYHPLITFAQPGPLRPAGQEVGSFVRTTQPIVPVDLGCNSDEVTFTVACFGAAGAPSSWSLGARFEFCLPNVDSFQYSRELWFPLDEANVAGCIVEKCGFAGPGETAPIDGGFGLIAKNTTVIAGNPVGMDNPVIVQRTIKHFGMRVRLALDVQVSGGTNPGINVVSGYFRRQG